LMYGTEDRRVPNINVMWPLSRVGRSRGGRSGRARSGLRARRVDYKRAEEPYPERTRFPATVPRACAVSVHSASSNRAFELEHSILYKIVLFMREPRLFAACLAHVAGVQFVHDCLREAKAGYVP
jgi:hypothetical protein